MTNSSSSAAPMYPCRRSAIRWAGRCPGFRACCSGRTGTNASSTKRNENSIKMIPVSARDHLLLYRLHQNAIKKLHSRLLWVIIMLV